MIYIATVWHRSSAACCVDDHEESMTRRVVKLDATDERDFEAQVRDRWINDVDADIYFGPISLSKINKRGMFADV